MRATARYGVNGAADGCRCGGWAGLLVPLLCGALFVLGCGPLPLPLPDEADSPVDTTGYTIEPLPVLVTASYARSSDIYLGCSDGKLYRADDADLTKSWAELSNPLQSGPRLLHASQAGSLFISRDLHPTWRSTDGGQTWAVCLDSPVWRMDEDELGNLYAGNYIKDDQHVAMLYKSTDGGATWGEIYRNSGNHHIHTVRWDNRAKRLYIAFGDGRGRGQAYSDDRGQSFTILAAGPGEGHTDVTFTADFVIWASDDQSGRIFRVGRQDGDVQAFAGSPQFMWFAVSDAEQVYVGTTNNAGGQRATLLASADQGATWQNLLQSDLSQAAYDQAFFSESRQLSTGKWLYFTGASKSWRVRRMP